MIRTFLKLALVALVANATWHAFGAFSPHYKLKDGIEYAAQHRDRMTDEELGEKIMDLIAQYDVPVAPADVSVTHSNMQTVVDLSYVRKIELVPGFFYSQPLSIHVDVLTFVSPATNSSRPPK